MSILKKINMQNLITHSSKNNLSINNKEINITKNHKWYVVCI
jgi:hypothetical protein